MPGIIVPFYLSIFIKIPAEDAFCILVMLSWIIMSRCFERLKFYVHDL